MRRRPRWHALGVCVWGGATFGAVLGHVSSHVLLEGAQRLPFHVYARANAELLRPGCRAAELHRNHARFCEKQLENKKTRAVLAAAFGEERADAYMSSCMFDYNAASPDDPPFTDGAIRQLYHYMSDNPEPWPDADRCGGGFIFQINAVSVVIATRLVPRVSAFTSAHNVSCG